jgi:hypothetical protein
LNWNPLNKKEGEESYIVNLAVDTGKKKKEMEQVKFKPLPRRGERH